jgi:tubulin polyglutamylase TTLL5
LIFKKIDDIIVKTIIAAESIINNAVEMYVPFKNNCFEVLGFDVLIDDRLEPWLLEVNLTPSLGCDTPLDQKVKANMIADLFSLSGVVPLDMRNYSDAGNRK